MTESERTESPVSGEFWIIRLGRDLTVGRCVIVGDHREWEICGDEQWFEEGEGPNWSCLPVCKLDLAKLSTEAVG